MALTRVPRNAASTVEHTFYLDETATDSGTTVTYAVVDANGDAVASGNASSAGVGTGRYTFTLPAQSALMRGTVTWAGTIGGAATAEVDQFEVVGGFFFGLKEARDSDASLSSTATYPTSAIRARRVEVETECEDICDRAFAPRYDRVVLDGSGTGELVLRHSDPNRSIADVRRIRSVTVAPRLDEEFVALTEGQLAALSWSADGVLTRTDGDVWTYGGRNVVVEYEYGLDAPPAGLVTAALTRLRTRLNVNRNGIPDRASSFTVTEGGTFRLDMPGAWKTGIPEVDAVYARYSRRSGSGTNARQVPASRTLNFDPQRTSLFHGGVR